MPEPAPPRPEERGDPAPRRSLLDVVSRIAGQAPRIQLRDESSAGTADPPASTDTQSGLPEMPEGTHAIRRLIASGGMGSVYKGRDLELGRDVAVKVLHTQFAREPAVLQRFVEEAQIGGQLQHPGIVPVYEMGLMADERPFFTMKLVKGRTLSALLAERESPARGRRRFLDLFEAVCQTLAYTHSRGVIHRDIKPANVMVGAFGEVQVVDWGLAKVLRKGATREELRAEGLTEISVIETIRSADDSDGSGSMVGSVLGTPGYMPPEQARGKVEDLDQRSDVFSLGAVLCEILTGEPPYPGPRAEALRAAARADLEAVEERLRGSGAEPELVALCLECLSPAPGARPANAGILTERLHAHLGAVDARGQEARVAAAEARARASQEARARRLTLGVAAAVVATVALGGWLLAWLDGQRAAREAQVAVQVDAALGEAQRALSGGGWNEALAAVERARGLATADLAATLEEQAGAIEAGARAAIEAGLQTDRRAALLSELRRLAALPAPASADPGAAYAAAFADAGVDLANASDDEVVERLEETGLAVELCLGLDEWARRVERVRGGRDAESERLRRIAIRADGDRMRSDIRVDENKGDLGRWVSLASVGLGPDAAIATVRALAGALAGGGERAAAVDLLRRAAERVRDDYDLHADLARLLLAEPGAASDPARVGEALEYATAAVALRPEEPVTLRLAGRAHALVGELETANVRFGAALESDPTLEPRLAGDGDAIDQLLLASALQRTGRGAAARAALARGRAALGPESRPERGGEGEEEGEDGAAADPLRALLDAVSAEVGG